MQPSYFVIFQIFSIIYCAVSYRRQVIKDGSRQKGGFSSNIKSVMKCCSRNANSSLSGVYSTSFDDDTRVKGEANNVLGVTRRIH